MTSDGPCVSQRFRISTAPSRSTISAATLCLQVAHRLVVSRRWRSGMDVRVRYDGSRMGGAFGRGGAMESMRSRDLAERVLADLLRRGAKPLPVDALVRLLDVAFFASMRTEESRALIATLAVV